MEINRNQYFAIGVVVLLLGVQFRYVESFTLNDRATEFVRERMDKDRAPSSLASTNTSFVDYFTPPRLVSRKLTVEPPKWIGWVLLSTGGVLVLHSLAMPRPS